MTAITPEAMRIIDLAETMGQTLYQVQRVLEWPDLTVEERLAAITAVVMMDTHGPSPEALAAKAGVDPRVVASLCKRRGTPLEIVGPDGSFRVVESEALAYGAPR